MPQTHNHLLALDIGDKRVGLATANMETLLSMPLDTIANDDNLLKTLKKLVSEHHIETVVVGLPRNLSGQDSQQTAKVREFIVLLQKELNLEIVAQDETLSSVRAEDELKARGKIYAKADIDKLAACYILEDYIKSLR